MQLKAANKVTGAPHNLICRELFHRESPTFTQHCSSFCKLGSDRCIVRCSRYSVRLLYTDKIKSVHMEENCIQLYLVEILSG